MVAILVGLLLGPPTIEAPVTDPLDHIAAAEEDRLDQALRALRAQTGVQMAVVIVDTADGPVEDFAQAIFDDWEGGSAERDDGVLLVFAIADRRSRLHLGYGVEPFIPDAEAKRILDDQRPDLRASAYGAAALGVVEAVGERVASLAPGAPIRYPLGFRFLALALVLLCGLAAGAYWRWAERAGRLSRPQTVALWVAAPLVLMLVFHAGPWIFMGYAVAWWGAGLAGIGAYEIAVDAPGRALAWAVTCVLFGGWAAPHALPSFSISHGVDVMRATAVFALALFGALVATYIPGRGGGVWVGGGSSSSGGGGWSGGGGGWSGGGGGSGGGGASSSW